MNRPMPRSLEVQGAHTDASGRSTSLVHRGYLYRDGDVTWELGEPMRFLKDTCRCGITVDSFFSTMKVHSSKGMVHS